VSLTLIIIAVVVIAIGAEALMLSRHRTRLPQSEIDKMIYGESPPPLSQASRNILERKVVVRTGASTQAVGILFIVVGLVIGAAGVGWI
jgi:hypothetical protein